VRRSRADEAHGQAVELVFVAAQEFLEGGDVLAAGAPHQYFVGQAGQGRRLQAVGAVIGVMLGHQVPLARKCQE